MAFDFGLWSDAFRRCCSSARRPTLRLGRIAASVWATRFIQSDPRSVLGIDPFAIGMISREYRVPRARRGRPPEQHVDDLFEIEQPERSFRLRADETSARSPKTAPIRCMERRAGRPVKSAEPSKSHSAAAIPLDLPTPVEPKHREVLGEHSSTSTIGNDGGILLQGADIDLSDPTRIKPFEAPDW